MKRPLHIILAQKNPVIGDVDGAIETIALTLALVSETADLVVFPELFLTGYPPRDFLYESTPKISELESLSKRCPETAFIVGLPYKKWNGAAFFYQGKLQGVQGKQLLPNYDVFDESRYFEPAQESQLFELKNHKIGIAICEDSWAQEIPGYPTDPIKTLCQKGADQIIIIMASPYEINKPEKRNKIILNHIKKHGIPIAYVNQVGANDELIFDGSSAAFDAAGTCLAKGPFCQEALVAVPSKRSDSEENLLTALAFGIQEYVRKTAFKKVWVGLSGGIDSAVVAALAVKALGPENVTGLTMPSAYSSTGSYEDSYQLAKNLGIRCETQSITDILNAYPKCEGLVEENLQARIRGNLLMARANQTGSLVLTTGNKSEFAVGYCTLYGDMCGALAPIGDLYKTQVYVLAHQLKVIPENILTKAPSAELRPGQLDQDTLPAYEILDAILTHHIENLETLETLVARGYDPETVRWVLNAVKQNEYKRFQAPPVLKVSSRAFGSGRKMVLTSKNMYTKPNVIF
ncbi:MAG: NAD+ synthase [Candidatus Margulisbacteria bacterium]|nr:NAD+ synthase [Candidatus Margulisiibacteriota bacterium]